MSDAPPHIGELGSDEHFRLLIESVQDYAIFMLDPQGRVASWNPGAERIKGFTADEIIGRHFSVFFPPADVAAGRPERELAIATATARYHEQGWRVRKDGTEFWADVVITALRDHDGNLLGFAKVTRDLTERRRAQEGAKRLESETIARQAAEGDLRVVEAARREEQRQREKLRVTLASIGDAVIVTDDRGVVTFLNAVAETLTGWPADDAIGRPLDDVFHIVNEETRKPVESPVAKVLELGVTVGLANHTVLVARHGGEIPIDDSGAPIRDANGEIFGVVLVFRDVTEARRAIEARLRTAAIVESADDAIIGKDLDARVVNWNRGAERLYGYTAEEMIGNSLSIIMPPDRPDELASIMAGLRRGESFQHLETVRVAKGGRRIEVSLTISPIRDAEGRIFGAATIAHDITELKRTESSLRVLADASRTLAELVDLSTTLQKVAGLAVPSVADWCVLDLVEPEGTLRRVAIAHGDPAKIEAARALEGRLAAHPSVPIGPAHVLRTGVSQMSAKISLADLEAAGVDPEDLRAIGELGLESYICVPLRVRGKVIGVLTLVTAESGRVFSERDVRLAEDLASRAAVAIDNAQLYADLKSTDRRKDEFLAMLAHELRNPLAPIRNAMQILKLAADPASAEQAREVVERQVDHLARLVDDLLDVSRIMRGRVVLRKDQVELATVVAHAIETVQPVLDARGQRLEVSTAAPHAVLDADPARISQILGNLLHNAAKFSPGSSAIGLDIGVEDGQAVLRVRDHGVGIRPDLLPHVFDLFVQGDDSLQRSQGGLGIGLTLVKNLVEMHGGSVEAHSEGPGHGSEFVVRLPIVERRRVRDADFEPTEAVRVPASRRVLVVDDNVDAAETIATLIRMWGHEVRVVYDGIEALEAVQTLVPDVVLLDIGLPGINGYEVAQRIRKQAKLQTTVLAAMTGYGQMSDRKRSRDAGFDHHLTKPVDLETLRGILAGLR